MVEKNRGTNSRVYTTHGKKKNQGELAIINGQEALCYTDGNGEVVAYTPLIEIIKKCCMGLPTYQLDF
ncbi:MULTISPECIES: hypothetical protein [unclassified Clostridium]|uniref:hypothetical protein n=1 Tax=unclassified Clostridium TaxID=2614128 RepID=UPI0032172B87